MVKRYNIILVLLITLFVGLILGEGFANAQTPEVTNAQAPEVTVEQLKQRPEVYLEKIIKLRAKLKAPESPWGFPRPPFVLEDEKGNQFPVEGWALLEVPPPQPGEEEWWAQERPKTMGDYLNKWLLIKGKVKAKGGRFIPRIKGEHYIEVQSPANVQIIETR